MSDEIKKIKDVLYYLGDEIAQINDRLHYCDPDVTVKRLEKMKENIDDALND